jgi:hypothetical protein
MNALTWTFYRLLPLLPVACAVALMLWLSGRFSSQVALAIYLGVALAACGLAGLLLSTTVPHRINWRNTIASLPLGVAGKLAWGSLGWMVMVSLVAWGVLGLLCLIAFHPDVPGRGPTAQQWGLLVSWMIVAKLFAWIGGNGALASPGAWLRQRGSRVIALLPALGLLSIGLHLAGYSQVALLILAGPIVVIAGFYGLFIGLLLIVTSRKGFRWH